MGQSKRSHGSLEVAFEEELAKQLEELDTEELAEVLSVITNRICTIIMERCDEDYLDEAGIH